MPMKAAPNVPLRSKLIAIVGREEGRGAEGRGDGETLNLFLLFQPTFINIAYTYSPEQLSAWKTAVETKVTGIRDDEQSYPGTFFFNSGTRPIVQSRVSAGFGMVSARVRGAVHGKGYPNGGGLDPASRLE